MAKQKPERVNWNRQLLGALAGAFAGLVLSIVIPLLAQRVGTINLVLWTAVLGGAVASLEGFIRAGAALTRSQNRSLNLLVGLGLPALILMVIALLAR
ncbi:MAG TPA: hypothetical protein VGA03_07830 [Anaerolineales bacterium]|jgi:hypothetical protein